MFKTPITSTPLTSDAANSYFENRIDGASWNRDISFLATLRALLDTRMQDGDSVRLYFHSSNYNASALTSNSKRGLMSVLDPGFDENSGMIYIHNFNSSSPEDNEAWMKYTVENFESYFEGWHRVEKVTTFFRKTFQVACFINPDAKNVAIYVSGMTMREMHYLQCGIFSFMPWYFSKDEGVTELEMDLIKSLREKGSSENYEHCIAKIAERYDFKTARIRQLLKGFETQYEREQCNRVRANIDSVLRNLEDLNDRIASYLKQKNDFEIQLLGLETKIQQSSGEDSEIMEYFLCNKHLSLEYVSGSTMCFVVSDYLTYFDEDMVRKSISNKRSYIYFPGGRDGSTIIPPEDMEMLMKAIFLDEKLKVRCCAAYQISLNGGVSPQSQYEYSNEFSECTPNVHIDRYRCIGNYATAINNRLRDHDYIGAIEQCIASAKSLNFYDSPVMNEFMRRIYGISEYRVNMRCIELPDGKVVKPAEAITYLKEEKEKEAAANG